MVVMVMMMNVHIEISKGTCSFSSTHFLCVCVFFVLLFIGLYAECFFVDVSYGIMDVQLLSRYFIIWDLDVSVALLVAVTSLTCVTEVSVLLYCRTIGCCLRDLTSVVGRLRDPVESVSFLLKSSHPLICQSFNLWKKKKICAHQRQARRTKRRITSASHLALCSGEFEMLPSGGVSGNDRQKSVFWTSLRSLDFRTGLQNCSFLASRTGLKFDGLVC